MNLYHISQDQVTGYDTYSDAVVAANTAKEARAIHPSTYDNWDIGSWATSPAHVETELLGVAKAGTQPGVICASFHAG